MKALGRPNALLVSLFVLTLTAPGAMGQGRADATSCVLVESAGPPCIDKIDPPSWWTGLPSPMLLVHGSRLNGAKFTISGESVSISQSEIMANGHYAFLWLSMRGTHAQGTVIRARTAEGTATVPFRLADRTPAAHAGFSPTDVMYLIMTDRFADGDSSNDPHPSERSLPRGWHGGDFQGIEQHLDYLQDLGVTTVWMTPVYDNDGGNQAYHGYSATDLYGTDPHFGALADLWHLSDAIHRRGMKVVLDTVPNHVGAMHPWAKDPPMPDWFHGTREDHRVAGDRFRAVIDPHGTWGQYRDVTEGWFANVLPDLNQENPLVRQYLIQNVIWWVESTGADGLRYDTFPYVGRAFWQALDQELHGLYPHLTTVGEVFNGDPVITSYFAGGVTREGIDTGLTTPFDFPEYFALRHALLSLDSGQYTGMLGLAEVLSEDWLYPHPERLVTFLGNHDTGRFMSQTGATVPDLKLGFALLATIRGMPQIYSGDEIAMRGGEDPDNRRDFPGGFPDDARSAFTAGGRTPEQAEVHDWVASLFGFRQRHAVLATGQQQNVFADEKVFVFVRAADLQKGCSVGGDRMMVAVNASNQPREVKVPLHRTALEGCDEFVAEIGGHGVMHAAGSELTLTLAPKQAEILSAR